MSNKINEIKKNVNQLCCIQTPAQYLQFNSETFLTDALLVSTKEITLRRIVFGASNTAGFNFFKLHH